MREIYSNSQEPDTVNMKRNISIGSRADIRNPSKCARSNVLTNYVSDDADWRFGVTSRRSTSIVTIGALCNLSHHSRLLQSAGHHRRHFLRTSSDVQCNSLRNCLQAVHREVVLIPGLHLCDTSMHIVCVSFGP